MMNIKKLIQQGEGVTLDFKKTITDKRKIAKTMCSFANNKGGMLLVGIMDSGEIKGVKAEDEERYMLLDAAKNYIKPAIEIAINDYIIDGKIVLTVHIDESTTKPHSSLSDDDKWWVYVRTNDKSVLASKIVIDVLKRENKSEPNIIEYSSMEKALLEYLAINERTTLKDYCEIINISRRRAQRIMVNLVLTGIIRVHTTEKTEYYTQS